MNTNVEWYALSTRQAANQKFKKLLRKKNIEFYSPINHVLKSAKTQDYQAVPLFPNIIFIKADNTTLEEMKTVKHVSNVFYWQNRPATFPDDEIQQMQTFLGVFFAVKAYKIERSDSLPITIPTNILPDHISNRVILPTIGFCLVAQIQPVTNIRLVKNSTRRFSAANNLVALFGLR